MPTVLTVSGSLRAGSSNTALLEAIARVAPAGVAVASYDALAELPPFHPDVDQGAGPLPPAVVHWRGALAAADAVLLSSPEYAHGVPGVLKNALDWVVGSGELVGRPVGLLSASAASRFAHPQLAETLRVMSARLVPHATAVVDVPRRGLTEGAILADPMLASRLRAVLDALLAAAAAEAEPSGHDRSGASPGHAAASHDAYEDDLVPTELAAADRDAVEHIVDRLERAWNAMDGAAFAAPFSGNADFVTVRGEHVRGRADIAAGHAAIFERLYPGSTNRYTVDAVRLLRSEVALAHVRAELDAPRGPLAGRHASRLSLVLMRVRGSWEIAALHNTMEAEAPRG